jgi:hypothetical protein
MPGFRGTSYQILWLLSPVLAGTHTRMIIDVVNCCFSLSPSLRFMSKVSQGRKLSEVLYSTNVRGLNRPAARVPTLLERRIGDKR